MKITLPLFFLLACAPWTQAQIPVTDYGALGQRAFQIGHQVASQAVNVTEYVYTATNTLNTYLTAYDQYLNQLTQLARMGDASALRNLPGVSSVADLYQSGQRLYGEYGRLQYVFNPGNYQGDMNSILSSYEQPNWNGFTSYSGYRVSPDPSRYAFDTAQYNGITQVEKLLDGLQEEHDRLLQQRRTAYDYLQSASNDAHTRKYAANLADVNAAISQNEAKQRQAKERGDMSRQKVLIGQQISQKAQADQREAQIRQSVDSELSVLPASDYHQTVNWNQ